MHWGVAQFGFGWLMAVDEKAWQSVGWKYRCVCPAFFGQGLFYPELGVLAISGTLIKAQCGGAVVSTYPNPIADTDQNINSSIFAMINTGANFKARAEEDISSTHYFVRVRNAEYNFSNNNTFTTGSGVMAHSEMVRDPQVYITTVGLYNDENELVAVSKLSKPLLKNFTREATIRVKLDY